jgi:hypothetical protein
MALSKAEGPFDRPFDKLTVLSKVEGLMALSKAEGRRTSKYAAFLKIHAPCIWSFFLFRLICIFTRPSIITQTTMEGHKKIGVFMGTSYFFHESAFFGFL